MEVIARDEEVEDGANPKEEVMERRAAVMERSFMVPSFIVYIIFIREEEREGAKKAVVEKPK